MFRAAWGGRALAASVLAALMLAGLPATSANALTPNPQGDTITDAASTGKPLEIQSATRGTDPTTLTITITTYTAFTDDAADFIVPIDTNLDGSADYVIEMGPFVGQTPTSPGTAVLAAGLSSNTPRLVKVDVTRPTTSSIAVSLPRSLIGGSTGFDWGVLLISSPSGGGTLNTDQAPDTLTVHPSSNVPRVAGADRIDTAVQASFFYDGTAGAVVLARSDDYPDALAGAPLADAKNAPLLLTDPGALDPRVLAEIKRVLPAGGTVYLLGGLSALSQAVQDAVTANGFQAVRYNGADRYDTALQIASKGLNDPNVILLTTGTNFADALSAGAAAGFKSGALLLTNGTTMPASVTSYLQAHPSDSLYAVGGPAAAAEPSAIGITGTDRYDTAKKVATTFFNRPLVVGIASGINFPDALAGGATIAEGEGPLLLTKPDALSTPAQEYLTNEAPNGPVPFIFGGTAAVSDAVSGQIKTALGF